MLKKMKLIFIVLSCLVFTAACSSDNATDAEKQTVELTISAAASLKDALEVIQAAYEDENPEVKLTFNFAGSGSLQQQISQGAPVDLFFSAAEDKYDLLVEEGSIAEDDGIDLLGNELVLVVPEGDTSVEDFNDLVNDEVKKISIGTPETVPAGTYGQEALENMKIWDQIESKLVFAKDVRQVLSYVETGNVNAGIVYKTDALVSDKVKIVATAEPVTHAPIIYPVGVIKDSKNNQEAHKFYQYLKSEKSIKVFEDYGFTAQ